MANILIVDDEKEIADLVEIYLKNENYNVYKYYSSKDLLKNIDKLEIDLAILDVMMPDIDGFKLCNKIREKYNFPIIFVTAKVENIDKITGLSIGADDYITKPFSIKELMARINRIILRNKKNTIIQVQNIKFDMDKMVVYRDNENVELTNLELKILNLLFLNLNKVVKRSEIIDKIWEWTGNDVNDNTVTVYLKRIREKIKTDIIITIKGIGYRIDSEVY